MENQVIAFPPLIEWSVAGRPIRDESESGDLHVVESFPNGILVGVVDGLGHGREAAVAARVAVSVLARYASEPLISLVKVSHERLRGTRGVAMTIASINALDDTIAWLAVGNVEGVLVRRRPPASQAREYVVLRGGVVGENLPSLRASTVSIAPGDLLIMATDGIGHGFAERLNHNDSTQAIADRILAVYAKSTDDALVLVARYLGRAQ